MYIVSCEEKGEKRELFFVICNNEINDVTIR